MGRDVEYPLTPVLEANLSELLRRINKIRHKYGKPLVVTSGYRPGKYNLIAGGSSKSAHLTCEAVDFADTNRDFTNWIMSNPGVLIECDLYMESPAYTPSWTHLQSRATLSGRRIFNK